MSRTLDFYNLNADRMTAAYETVSFSRLVMRFAEGLAPGTRVLDLGCGSGRDAAMLLAAGLDVTATDGSSEMLYHALRLHPELQGRAYHVLLPGTLPFADRSFQGVACWAVIMHLQRYELPLVFSEIARVLDSGGVLAYSVNTQRNGLDDSGTDEAGRHFTCMRPDEWEALHREAGLLTEHVEETDDIAHREGIRWATFFARRR